jgi:hypothetical protein
MPRRQGHLAPRSHAVINTEMQLGVVPFLFHSSKVSGYVNELFHRKATVVTPV